MDRIDARSTDVYGVQNRRDPYRKMLERLPRYAGRTGCIYAIGPPYDTGNLRL